MSRAMAAVSGSLHLNSVRDANFSRAFRRSFENRQALRQCGPLSGGGRAEEDCQGCFQEEKTLTPRRLGSAKTLPLSLAPRPM
jgi:hypothetical protein